MVTRSESKGFTIVELLIVIVVMGILAAIIIVSYNGVTNSARVSSVKSDLNNMLKKLEVFKATSGAYPTNLTDLENAGLKANKTVYDTRNNLYYLVDTNGRWYAIGAIARSVSYCLESGSLRVNGGANCSNWANTGTNVRNQATAAGVDGATISLWGNTGYDWPGDGAGSGWQAWLE